MRQTKEEFKKDVKEDRHLKLFVSLRRKALTPNMDSGKATVRGIVREEGSHENIPSSKSPQKTD